MPGTWSSPLALATATWWASACWRCCAKSTATMNGFGELQDRAKRNEPLARYTTARIGGPADLLVEVRTVDELLALARRAEEIALPYLVLGGGANVLVSDLGVRGLVIVNRTKEIKF